MHESKRDNHTIVTSLTFFVELFILFVCQFSFIVFCFNVTGNVFFSTGDEKDISSDEEPHSCTKDRLTSLSQCVPVC